MIDLRQLQALSAVAAEGSVSRAAVRLGWSQPTVDYHLRNLDNLVGTALTSRSTRGSTLTAAGSLMLERGSEILALSDRALTDVRELAQLGRTRLRFGTFPTAAAHLLPGIAARLTELGIDLDAVLTEVAPLVEQVNQNTIDAALVYTASGYGLPFRSEVHTTRILRDPLLLAVPEHHPAAQHDSIDLPALRSLHEEAWVFGATPGDTIDDIVRDLFTADGHTAEVALRTDDYSVVLGMVAAGLGVGLVPKLAAAHPPAGVALRPLDDPRFAREILLAAKGPASGPPPAVRQLAEALRRTVESLA
ncbi:LysR family transcriptional regulator [Leucobacter sp. OLJS4]|uniref:LysR family transcriptional regulator n=1 Tax=unclassified Leucobacter TaxID=2621730 RepID=UPI000C1A61C2|nr:MULTISPECIES: LysR family transcriptional regulator [unclassified Leucobacter]PIJ54610.1 LysR family transcriptional regulator [Leucobacter sp. OLES1]PII83266.1 LysR family transcriptional regulator [Leucobacter sp. OLCALW19]PII86817.1 LysR family transcriptional regulator [Leucobacter sp. OLTLW20]PII91247.1 LysR family transcriptional regulator [Leucobacter sp. OLAS13]PII96861.1 LysR family transcriptional regulator [Leucobacter sp. OLCS4]